MNKQKLIEYCEYLKGDLNKFINGIDVNKIIKMIEQLDEPQKVMIPQFVADWYEEYNFDLEFNIWDWIKYTQEEEKIKNRQFTEWLGKSENDPVETLVKMKLFGYDVEEEKRYLVKVKGVNDYGCYLNKGLLSKEYFWESKAEIGGCRTKHTRKQLEDDDFGWVFDCEGIEIEEVENELLNYRHKIIDTEVQNIANNFMERQILKTRMARKFLNLMWFHYHNSLEI